MNVTLSNNELRTTIEKACKGSGYSWGVAEECGRVFSQTNSLYESNPKILSFLMSHLETTEQLQSSNISKPLEINSLWSTNKAEESKKTTFDPISLGCSIIDRKELLCSHTLRFSCDYPLILIPFIVIASRLNNIECTIQLKNNKIQRLNCDTLSIGNNSLDAIKVNDITITTTIKTDSKKYELNNTTLTIQVSKSLLERYKYLARLIQVPESEESKFLGAGSGLTDND